ncbi:MAG: hypothetical protein RL324_1421 [Verrucomicrobiota bacterium]
MNTSKSKTFVILLLVLAVIGIGTYAWRQQDELNGLRTSKVSEKDMAAARARAFEAEKRNKELEAELALAKATPPAEAVATNGRGNRGGNNVAANGAAGQPPGPGGPGGRGNNPQLQAILQTPQAMALQATADKANISVQYAGFFRTAGLTGEQADAVTTLMSNRNNLRQDLMAAAQAAGMATDPQSLQALVTEQQSQIDSQLKTTMGDTAYAQYQTYQATLSRRQEVASYQQQLTMAGVPLDANQAEALIAALGPSTNAAAGGGRGGGGGFGGGGGRGGPGGGGVTNISANNITAAASVLNATQLQVLQATQQAQQAQSSLGQLTGGARGAQQPQRGAATATGGAVTTGAAAAPNTRGAAAGATRATRGN